MTVANTYATNHPIFSLRRFAFWYGVSCTLGTVFGPIDSARSPFQAASSALGMQDAGARYSKYVSPTDTGNENKPQNPACPRARTLPNRPFAVNANNPTSPGTRIINVPTRFIQKQELPSHAHRFPFAHTNRRNITKGTTNNHKSADLLPLMPAGINNCMAMCMSIHADRCVLIHVARVCFPSESSPDSLFILRLHHQNLRAAKAP
mmetsp:Transcript_44484/g.85092  ORF Transcript_44484/g.85092 Transcript_44484/m.85092 type:complete len:206 (-) Transcript_44484:516-1133(-)